MPSQSEINDMNALKARMKAMWMGGDFSLVAQYISAEAEQFVARLPLKPGMKLLDVACGSGNVSIPAARAGAIVTGVDIAANLLEAARARAEQEGLAIQFDEGDAEELPYADGQFDAVVSTFGAMFAPRPEKAAAELVRVCRSGGFIAMANWTPAGFVGKTFQLCARFAPPPPGLPAPVLWGDENIARQRFAGISQSVEVQRREALMDHPFSAAEAVQFHRNYLGPTRAAFARLDEAGQQQLAAEMEKLYSEHNQGGAVRTVIRAEYLEVLVRKA